MDIKSTDTALVITDPQNDVPSENGVAWALVGKSIAANRTVEHIGAPEQRRLGRRARVKTRQLMGVAGALMLSVLPTSAAAQSGRPPKNVSVDEAIACIRTAAAAKPGRVKELDVRIENGATRCQVEIAADDRRKYEVHVDVVTNKVIRIEDD